MLSYKMQPKKTQRMVRLSCGAGKQMCAASLEMPSEAELDALPLASQASPQLAVCLNGCCSRQAFWISVLQLAAIPCSSGADVLGNVSETYLMASAILTSVITPKAARVLAQVQC